MFRNLSEPEKLYAYSRYRNNPELLREDKPTLYRLYEYHLKHKPIFDIVNDFNNWIYETIFHDDNHNLD
jgi:hypothetical protein